MSFSLFLVLVLFGYESIEAAFPHGDIIPKETEIESSDHMFSDSYDHRFSDSFDSVFFGLDQRDDLQSSGYHFASPGHEPWHDASTSGEPRYFFHVGLADDPVLEHGHSHDASIDQAHHSNSLAGLNHNWASTSTEASPQLAIAAAFHVYDPNHSINEMDRILRSSEPENRLTPRTKSKNILEEHEQLQLLESKEKEILLQFAKGKSGYFFDASVNNLPVPLAILDSMSQTENVIASFYQLIRRWVACVQNKHVSLKERVLAILMLAHQGSFSKIGRVAFANHLESNTRLQDLSINLFSHYCHFEYMSTSTLLEIPLIDLLRSANTSERLFGLRDILLYHDSKNFMEVFQRKLLVRLLLRTCQEQQKRLEGVATQAYRLGYSRSGRQRCWFEPGSAVGKAVAIRLYSSIFKTLRMEPEALSSDQQNILKALLGHLDRYEPSIKSMVTDSPVQSKVHNRPDPKYQKAPRPLRSTITRKPSLPPTPTKRSRIQAI